MRNVQMLLASVALVAASQVAHANEFAQDSGAKAAQGAAATTLVTAVQPATATTVQGEANAPELSFWNPGSKSAARMAAIADSASTLAAISAGASELNPLVNANPVGLLLLAGLKFGFVELADRMPEAQRHSTLRFSTALWSGVSVSNVLVAASLANPAALAVGVAASWYVWVKGDRKAVDVPAEELAKVHALADAATARANATAAAE